MSDNVSTSIRGRVSGFGVRPWLIILVLAVGLFLANFLAANYYQSQETSARTMTADLQVLSQQLAKYAQEAVSGNADSFAEFKDTKAQIDARVKALRTGGTVAKNTVPGYEGSVREKGVD